MAGIPRACTARAAASSNKDLERRCQDRFVPRSRLHRFAAVPTLLAVASALLGPPAAFGGTARPPAANGAVIGMALSGEGAHLLAPTSPTLKPYSGNCHTLVDPAFKGKCVTATSSAGTVAGVVEVERGAFGGQERDLVWRKQGLHWALALVHVSESPRLNALVWRCELRPGAHELVFVLPSALPGFGSELDVVEGNGQVSLYRSLGVGFADVPVQGDLVTYVRGPQHLVPSATYFNQTLISWLGGSWRVVAQQYVPYSAALGQHRGEFWAAGAAPAS